MGDPFSIAAAAISVTSTASKISCSLYEFISTAKKVDKTIELLYTTVIRLEASLKNVQSTLQNESVLKATTKQELFQGSLKAIDHSLQDCQHTLQVLVDILPDLPPPNQRFFSLKKTVLQLKLSLGESEMDSLRSHIQSHSTSLQIAMQTLTLDITCHSSQGLGEDLTTGLNTLAEIITDLSPRDVAEAVKNLPEPFVKSEMPIHTQSIVTNAQQVMSAAESALSEPSRSVSRKSPGSDTRFMVPSETRDRIISWIPSERAASSFPDTETGQEVFTPDATANELTPTEETSESGSLDDESHDVEAAGILLEMGTDYLSKSNFRKAEDCLRKGIAEAESMKPQTHKQFQIDDKHLWLAFCQLYQGKGSDALPAFQVLSKAKPTSKDDMNRTLWAVYGLALIYIHDVRRPDYDLAELNCRKILKNSGKICNNDTKYCGLYCRSLNVLAEICLMQGDTATASTYVDHLQGFECKDCTHKQWFNAAIEEPTVSHIQRLGCKVRDGDKVLLHGLEFNINFTVDSDHGSPSSIVDFHPLRKYGGQKQGYWELRSEVHKAVKGMCIDEMKLITFSFGKYEMKLTRIANFSFSSSETLFKMHKDVAARLKPALEQPKTAQTPNKVVARRRR